MKAYLFKAVEITKWLATKLIEIGRWAYARMNAVEIEQPRGVTLCVVFQLVVLLVLMIILTPAPAPVEPRPGKAQEPSVAEEATLQNGAVPSSAVEPTVQP